MTKPVAYWCATALLACTASLTQAQTTTNPHVLAKPPAGIVVDGDLHEWGGDSLKYYNPALMMGYALANDHDNIYIAVRISDHSQQARVLNNGLTISINTKGKKKDTYSITFPVGSAQGPMQQAMQQMDNSNAPQDHDEAMRAKLTSLRNIRVTGFKDVESDVITTANTYGFKTAMSYDDNGYLLYEVAIPFKFFEQSDIAAKTEWAFNFKVNGFKEAHADNDAGNNMQGGGMGRGGRGGMGGGGGGGMGRGGRGGMGGGMSRGSSSQGGDMSKTADFWDKFYLAPAGS